MEKKLLFRGRHFQLWQFMNEIACVRSERSDHHVANALPFCCGIRCCFSLPLSCVAFISFAGDVHFHFSCSSEPCVCLLPRPLALHFLLLLFSCSSVSRSGKCEWKNRKMSGRHRRHCRMHTMLLPMHGAHTMKMNNYYYVALRLIYA